MSKNLFKIDILNGIMFIQHMVAQEKKKNEREREYFC